MTRLKGLIVQIIMAHTSTSTRVWAHIMGPRLRSWPFCDIWKGQERHHSYTNTHFLTSTPSGVGTAPPFGSSILRLTSGIRISLPLQGLDSTHSFHLAVPQPMGATHRATHTHTLTHPYMWYWHRVCQCIDRIIVVWHMRIRVNKTPDPATKE